MNILFLTCASSQEAALISRTLLEGKLIACAKSAPVTSRYLWKGNIENSDEVLLIMESEESKFAEIEKVVKSIHSYEQFVLIGFPITQMATGVDDWLKSETGSKN